MEKLRSIHTAPTKGDVLGVIRSRNSNKNTFLEVLSVNIAKPINEEDKHFTHASKDYCFHPNRKYKTTDFELLGWVPLIDVKSIEL